MRNLEPLIEGWYSAYTADGIPLVATWKGADADAGESTESAFAKTP